MRIWRESMDGKDFKLSRNYARAWELIQQGEKLACWVETNHRKVVANAYYQDDYEATKITDNEWNYLDMLENNNFNDFAKRCTELNIEFYLPVANSAIPIVVVDGATVNIKNFSF